MYPRQRSFTCFQKYPLPSQGFRTICYSCQILKHGTVVSYPSTAPEEMRVCWSRNKTTVTLCCVSCERDDTPNVQPSTCAAILFLSHLFYLVAETHHTGSHATRAAPPLLGFGEGVRLGFVVSTADLFHLSVETIWGEETNMITHTYIYKIQRLIWLHLPHKGLMRYNIPEIKGTAPHLEHHLV